MFIYIENDTETHRNTQNINMSPKYTKNTKTPLNLLKQSKQIEIYIFLNFQIHGIQLCMLIFMALFIFYVEGHTA